MKRATIFAALLLAAVAAAMPRAARADDDSADAAKLVNEAAKTLDNFIADPDVPWFREHADEAKGLLICPQIVRAGFILGGSGGRCVFVAKGDGGWNGPAFYSIGTASIGFQAGVDVAEVISLAMTQKAVDTLMSAEFKVGAGASVAVGPVGTGASAQTADFIAYTRNKGVYGGVDLSGAVIKPSGDYNKAYYGKGDTTAIEIIAKGAVHNPHARVLLGKVEKLYADAKKKP